MKSSVEYPGATSILKALVLRQIRRTAQTFIFPVLLLVSFCFTIDFTKKGPAKSSAKFVQGGHGTQIMAGNGAIFCFKNKALKYLHLTQLLHTLLTSFLPCTIQHTFLVWCMVISTPLCSRLGAHMTITGQDHRETLRAICGLH